MDRFPLEGASAIVTGGASGIGEACARQLAALGARVVVADLQEEKGQAVASDIGGLYVKCDVSSEEDGQTAVAAATEMGPLRALVNSAGIGWANRTVDRNNDPMPQEQFDFVIKVNLLGSFNMLRLAAAQIAKNDPVDADGQRGAIVNLRLRRRVRRPDRSGRLLGVEGWRRRHDPADRPRPRSGRRSCQHRGTGPHRDADLRRG